MDIKVLGCSGGIGAGLRTTSLLVDHEILIDAGSGVGDLTMDEMAAIRHIFLTHSHLDHIGFIPLLIDAVFEGHTSPITIHGLQETLKAVQQHIFNWSIWPNFAELPTPENPILQFEIMTPGEVMQFENHQLEMIAVNHSVPGVGYRIESNGKSMAFSGDTTTNDNFWNVLNSHDALDLLLVEVAFSNDQKWLAEQSYHYCPELLAADLAKLNHQPEVFLTHLKPGDENAILDECQQQITTHKIKRLVSGDTFRL